MQGAAIHGLELGQRQILDVLSHIGVLRIALHERCRVQALLARDLAVVGDHGHAVLGDLCVQLQGGDTHLQRVAERGNTAFGVQPQAAAVGLQVKVAGLVEQVVAARTSIATTAGRHQAGACGRHQTRPNLRHLSVFPKYQRTRPARRAGRQSKGLDGKKAA
ncbi:hypothetical protein D3C78_1312100 [compost metagenome]